MSIIIDVVLIALFVFLVVIAYKKGFLTTVIDTFSIAISAFATYSVFEAVAEKIYDFFVRNLVETRFTRVLEELSSSLSVTEKVNAMIDGLPVGAVKLAQAMGVNPGALASSMTGAGGLSEDELIQLAVDKIGHAIMINVTEVVTFIALFIVITIAVKLIAKIFQKANDIPVLGKLNGVLGAVIGIVKGAVIVYVVCTAFYFIAGMSGAAPVLEAVSNSKIYGIIIENNPIINLVG